MKKYLVIVNLFTAVTLIFLIWSIGTESERVMTDYRNEDNEINKLVKQYSDSTSKLRYYFNSEEIMSYSRLIKSDSLRIFLIRQATQADYFRNYQEQLRRNLNVTSYAIISKDRNYLILFIVALVNFIFVIILSVTLFRNSKPG